MSGPQIPPHAAGSWGWPVRRWLARLVDAEVRRLTRERDEAWSVAGRATNTAAGWHQAAVIEKARADALAAARKKESNTE